MLVNSANSCFRRILAFNIAFWNPLTAYGKVRGTQSAKRKSLTWETRILQIQTVVPPNTYIHRAAAGLILPTLLTTAMLVNSANSCFRRILAFNIAFWIPLTTYGEVRGTQSAKRKSVIGETCSLHTLNIDNNGSFPHSANEVNAMSASMLAFGKVRETRTFSSANSDFDLHWGSLRRLT